MQFLTRRRASEAFVRGTGADSAQRLSISARWMAERAIKEGGWPEKTVADVMSLPSVSTDWGLLVEYVNRRLVGAPEDDLAEASDVLAADQIAERETRRKDEIDALGAVYTSVSVCVPFSDTEPSDADVDMDGMRKANTREILIPLESAPEVVLHIVLSPAHPYPCLGARAPPIYITSPTQPPYLRLYLLAAILRCLRPNNKSDLRALLEAGEGIAFAVLPIVEEAWQSISAHGPPEIADVMAHLLPKRVVSTGSHSDKRTTMQNGVRAGRREVSQGDDRDDEAVRLEWDTVRESKAYKSMLESRMRLPAWNSREAIAKLLEKSRVLLCVGETGELPQLVLVYPMLFIKSVLLLCKDAGKRHRCPSSFLTSVYRRIRDLGQVSSLHNQDVSVPFLSPPGCPQSVQMMGVWAMLFAEKEKQRGERSCCKNLLSSFPSDLVNSPMQASARQECC